MRKKILTIILLASSCMLHTRAQILINEIMQSNVDCVMDDMNEFPDSWIELYNNSTETINLKGYALGTNKNYTDAYRFPTAMLNNNSHHLIYCDKADTLFHTHFRIDSSKGGSIYLFNPQGDIIDQLIDIAKQPAPNIAYGRNSDGDNHWGYCLTPTPGETNVGGIRDKSYILGIPQFSLSGFVKSTKSGTFSLSLSLPENSPVGSVIRYTTDGSEPTKTSNLYTKTLTYNQSTIMRAKIFCTGYISPPSTAQSYIYLGREQTMPIVSIVGNNDYFYDKKIGIYVDGNYNNETKNYEYNWRRPINLEYSPVNSTNSVINQLCETRIMGAASRSSIIKSLAVYANKRFGTKRFEYEFWPEDKPNVTNNKSILLRNSGNDLGTTCMKDPLVQRTVGKYSDVDFQGYQPSIVYLNGKYLGMLAVRERSNEDNILANYDGLEDIDLITNWSECGAGDWENYNQFYAFMKNNHTLDEYRQWMNIEEFTNVFIANLYANNVDFPGNNIVMWRPREKGGKWRWIMKDLDFTAGLYNSDITQYDFNYLNYILRAGKFVESDWGANNEKATLLFRQLIAIDEYREYFLDRCLTYLGDWLNAEHFTNTINQIQNEICVEYPYMKEQLRISSWVNWENELENMKTWYSNRSTFLPTHLRTFFKLGRSIRVSINQEIEDTNELNVEVNDITLSEGKFNGRNYVGRTMKLDGTYKDNSKTITGWALTTILPTSTETKILEGSSQILTIAPSNVTRISVNAIVGDATDILYAENITLRPIIRAENDGILCQQLLYGTEIQVFSTSGHLIYQSITNDGTKHIALPHKGIYIVKIISEGQTFTQKVSY